MICGLVISKSYCFSMFTRIKKGRALCIWLPCTGASRGPRFWSKTVTWLTKKHLDYPTVSFLGHEWFWKSIIKYWRMSSTGSLHPINIKFPPASVHRWGDWLCRYIRKHSSSCCCSIRPRVADQLSAVEWCRQGQVSLSRPDAVWCLTGFTFQSYHFRYDTKGIQHSF